jgi:hypothetical protein
MANDETVPVAPNPYESEASKSEKPRRRNAVTRIVLFAIAFGCLSVAGVLWFFAETFEIYTPYSAEKHWMISLPNGTGIWFDAQAGTVILISCLAIGISLMLWNVTSLRKPRP